MKLAHVVLLSSGLSLVIGCRQDVAKEPAPLPPSSVRPAESPPEARAVAPPPMPTTRDLADAVGAGNVSDVRIFLQRDPQAVHQPGANSMLPIHLAAQRGRSEVIPLLLQAGADVNTPHEKVHATPLQYAAAAGHLNAVRTLLAANARVNAVDTQGRTPLMWAASKGHVSVIQELLQRGADADFRTPGGWTALKYAQQQGHSQAVELLGGQKP